MKVSVIVPTYKRPKDLLRCMTSLLNQSRLPDQILAVTRNTDEESRKVIKRIVADKEQARFGADATAVDIQNSLVSTPGHLPPLISGLSQATGDIICVIDDDAEALPDWLELMTSYYDDSIVGGVGGMLINMRDDRPLEFGDTDIVGKVKWYGAYLGGFYKSPTFSTPLEVDFLPGGNMSFRREVWRQVEIDLRMNDGDAMHYEVDLGWQVRKLGYRILCHPGIVIKHHISPRAISADRSMTPQIRICRGHNHVYVMLKHLPSWRRYIFLNYYFLFGDYHSWGLTNILLSPLLRRRFTQQGIIVASIKGKVKGIQTYLQARAKGELR